MLVAFSDLLLRGVERHLGIGPALPKIRYARDLSLEQTAGTPVIHLEFEKSLNFEKE